MILELDVGNSAVKWRLLNSGEVVDRGVGRDLADCGVFAMGQLRALNVQRCRLVSVRSEVETFQLVRALQDAFGVVVAVARSSHTLDGVVNGYECFSRLGADRWLAVVAAFKRYKTACIVIDLGTAITIDWVNSVGRHEGGYIVPGLSLMVRSLEQGTQRIESIGQGLEWESGVGRSTASCVLNGSIAMIRSFVESQVLMARDCYGDNCVAVVSGGSGAILGGIAGLVFEPELVFDGLAIACP